VADLWRDLFQNYTTPATNDLGIAESTFRSGWWTNTGGDGDEFDGDVDGETRHRCVTDDSPRSQEPDGDRGTDGRTFAVVASGTAPLSYQWQKNGGVAISGATSSNYTTPATTTSDSGSSFSVVVTKHGGER